MRKYLARWREAGNENIDAALRVVFEAMPNSLVVGALNILLKQGEEFDTFTPGEHWGTDYAIWHRSISKFRNHYRLEVFSIRDIDKYLWMLTNERLSLRAASGNML